MSAGHGEKKEKRLNGAVLPLVDVHVGDKGKVEFLKTKDAVQLQQLMGIGVIPGVSIVLQQKFPAYVFSLGHSQFAVDKNLAQAIYVQVKM